MDPLIISALGEALIIVFKKIAESISDPLLKKSAELFLHPLVQGYDQRRGEVRLQAAIAAAIQEFKPTTWKQYRFEMALYRIVSNPKLAVQVAAIAIGMTSEMAERIPLDVLSALNIEKDARTSFAKFLFYLRRQLIRLDDFRDGIEYADRLEQQGLLASSLVAIRRQTEIYESILVERHLTLDDEKALQNYLDHVRKQSQLMPLPLTSQRSFGVPTDVDANEVFVPLTLRDSEGDQPDLENTRVNYDSNRPSSFPDIFKRYPCFLLKGPPGCGKTTLLHRAALAFASGTAQTELDWGGPALLPIFLRLRNFGTFLFENRDKFIGPASGALTAFMENHFREEHRLNLSANFFDRRLEEGQCLILLDGLDEVTTGREEVAQFVSAFVQEHGKRQNRFGIASRPKGYDSVEIYLRRSKPAVVEVNPLDANGIRKLVENLLMILDSNPAQREKDKADLPQAILSSPKLKVVAGTPLFCAALVLVYKYHGAHLPQRRVEVYSQIIDLLLGRWKAADSKLSKSKELSLLGTDSLDLSKAVSIKKKRLSYLALWMQENRLSDVTAERAQRVIRDYLKNIEGKESNLALQAEEFLRNAHEFSGLFVETEADLFSFTHQGFREFLAATALKNKREKDFVSLIQKYVTDDWWEEVILLTGAHPELADELRYFMIDLLLDGASDPKLSIEKRHIFLLMAGQCSADMAFLPDLRKNQVVEKLYNVMTQKELEPKKRLQAGEALDSLGWVPVDIEGFVYVKGPNDFWISKYPVTNQQYMRFLISEDYRDPSLWKSVQGFEANGNPIEDIGLQAWEWFIQNGGKDIHPRFWEDAYFGASRHLSPVVGVSWYEAAAYCAWLNRKYVGHENFKLLNLPVTGVFSFRLPKEQEWLHAFREKVDGSLLEQGLYSKVTREKISMYANTYESGLHRTTPVCMYPDGKTSEGIMDMIGNVWEWQASQRRKGKLEFALRGGAWTNVWGGEELLALIDDMPSGFATSCGFRVLVAGEDQRGKAIKLR